MNKIKCIKQDWHGRERSRQWMSIQNKRIQEKKLCCMSKAINSGKITISVLVNQSIAFRS